MHKREKLLALQAAYVRQFLEQVSQKQAHQGAGVPTGLDSKTPVKHDPGSDGEKRLKTETGWVAAAVKPDAEPEVCAAKFVSDYWGSCMSPLVWVREVATSEICRNLINPRLCCRVTSFMMRRTGKLQHPQASASGSFSLPTVICES